MRVRTATRDDLDAVLGIRAPILGLDVTRARALVAASIDARGCHVADAGDGVLDGYVVVRRREFFGRDLVVLLAVAERARRRGIGSALLDAALATSSTRRVFTSTNESNAPMRALLAVQGWVPSGRLEGLDEGDPELVFYRDAPDP